MNIQEIIFMVIWFVVSFLIAFYLHKKYSLFQKFWGVLTLFGTFFASAILHNLVYALLRTIWGKGDDFVFFFLALFAFGAGVFLLVIQIAKKGQKVLFKK